MEFKPKCGKGLTSPYVTANGHFKPCCWRPTVDPSFENDRYDLNKVDQNQAIKNIDKWLKVEVEKEIDDLDFCCKYHCVIDQEHKKSKFL